MEACFLVIGATDDSLLNRQISREAKRRGILCNIVDSPQECNFILPSLVRRGDLVLAVSTSGKSPALAKKIRRQLEKEFPEVYELYLRLLGKIRLHVLAQARPQEDNQRLFESLVDSPLLSWLAGGDFKAVTGFLDDVLDPPLPLSELAAILNNHPFPPNR
jgi:precorrin-2 dehydrogenase/sirohydrochlorin ferrochelatase